MTTHESQRIPRADEDLRFVHYVTTCTESLTGANYRMGWALSDLRYAALDATKTVLDFAHITNVVQFEDAKRKRRHDPVGRGPVQ